MNKMTGVQPEATCENMYLEDHGCDAWCDMAQAYTTQVKTYRDSVTHEVCYRQYIECKCGW